MGAARIVALGEWARVRGFAQAGVRPVAADGPDAVRAAWASLGDDVAVVILTLAARDALGDAALDGPLTVVLPP